eukprot:TRINITY_DN27291_c0_g2_i1.p1 TRINITY_DN27291_c0_g2~~TRINITY_DN27291_c0_g2_i1.p1  ORF type:complete len:215 (+),score=55.07 TRINITY_DN27291_c0_g2_i1:176-820(+)
MKSTLQQTTELLNGLPAEHVYALGGKIIGNLPNCTLNASEAQSVASALSLPIEKLHQLCDLIAWSFEAAALETMTGDVLLNHLTGKGVNGDQAAAICRVWSLGGRGFVSKLQTQVLGSPTFVSDVHWRIELESASSESAKSRNPLVLFDLELQTPISLKRKEVAAIGGGEPSKPELQQQVSPQSLRFQMSKDELLKFYDDLEKIQMQLDSLTPQ